MDKAAGRRGGRTARRFQAQDELLAGMGGLFILGIVLSTIFLWCDLSKVDVWLFVITLIGFGLIGLADDLYKIKQNNRRAMCLC